MIDERKMRAIELRFEGRGNTDIAKIINVSRTTIYNWFQEEEIKAELIRFEREIKNHAQSKYTSKVDTMIEHQYNLALTAESEKVQADCTVDWINRVLGKTTTRVELEDGRDGKDNVPVDILDKEIDEFDNE